MFGLRCSFILTMLVYRIANLIMLKNAFKQLSIVKMIMPVYFVFFIDLLIYLAFLIFKFKIDDKI